MPWCRAVFKGTEVLARCDGQGELVADGGRVEIRYRPSDSRAYRAAARNLAVVDGSELFPDAHCAQAQEPAPRTQKAQTPKGQKSSGTKPASVPNGAVIAYTDGACSGNPGPAGVGVVVIDGDQVQERSIYLGHGTNNIAELTAIEVALQVIGPTERPVRVHTDSQYSIGVLVKGWKAKANRELVARVREVVRRFPDVELIYVRGHAGVPLNERADELAVEAVTARASRP